MADETPTDDMNSASNETTEPIADAAEGAETTEGAQSADETAAEEGLPKKPMTAERAADVALGVGVVAVETLDRVARTLDTTVRRLVEDAPAVFADLEEKGRPVREKIADALRNRPKVADAFTSTGATDSAADEITALEDRVRELEQQVGGEAPPAPAEPSPFSMLEIDPPADNGEAPAAEAPKGRKARKADEAPEEPTVP
jgi:hypothetical protein